MNSGKMHRDRLEQIAIFLQLLDGSFDLGRSQATGMPRGAQLGNVFFFGHQLQYGGIVDIQSPTVFLGGDVKNIPKKGRTPTAILKIWVVSPSSLFGSFWTSLDRNGFQSAGPLNRSDNH